MNNTMRSSWLKALQYAITVSMIAPLFLIASAKAQSENGVAQSFGVVDMRSIIQQSNAMSTIRSALDEQNAAFQAAISEEELQLRQAERALNSAQSTLSEEEFSTQLRAFEERVIAIQRSIQSQKISFDRSIQQAQTQLEQELLKIVSEIAQERSLSLVIQRQNVVIYNNTIDITDESLARLNERTKNITLTRQDNLPKTEN